MSEFGTVTHIARMKTSKVKFRRSTPDATPVIHTRLRSTSWSEFEKTRNGLEDGRPVDTGRKLHEKNPLIQKKTLESKVNDQGLCNHIVLVLCQMCQCCLKKEEPI
ncbi:hypothetical protein ScPMuIL_006136 [Solemya velum]